MWDTAGQEHNASISKNYARNLEACLLVFDLTRRKSFQSVNKWLQELRNIKDIPDILVGNKYDLEEKREVTESDI